MFDKSGRPRCNAPGITLFHPEEIHKIGNQLFPVGFAVAAAYLAIHFCYRAAAADIFRHLLVPAVGLAGGVLLGGILQTVGLMGAPGEENPGVGADGICAGFGAAGYFV